MHAHTHTHTHTHTGTCTHKYTIHNLQTCNLHTGLHTHTSTPYAIYKPVTYTKNEHRFTLLIAYEKGKRGGSAALEKDIY